MRPPRSRTPADTTPQARLAAVIKSSRDVMRKDAGLNGDLDRIPQFAWLLFLKAFDDLEQRRAVTDRDYRPVLAERFQWREWAGDPVRRLTGERLLTFVNQELLPHLAGLRGSGRPDDARDTLAAVFGETRNRMVSGHLLYDLVDQVNKVHFTSSDDVHTMAHLYESMLREMRDAAGDSGEFYTPRPVVRFMVDMVDPRLGETVLDPAVGTGGFLVEAYEHLKRQATTTAQLRTANGSVIGIEKKPLPYLLCQMNLLLHEVDRPTVTRANALAHPLAEQRRQGVDVVLTNPPFGGEEEAHIPGNFPAGMRTAETSWLFLQLVMAKIARSPTGRAAVVVPNSVLSDGGVGAKVRAQLLNDFDLHTVVRLPEGVFAPYTPIPSSLLFFDRGRTEDVWFYEHAAPDGRRNYTKTKSLRYEEFEECAAWWGGRERVGRVEGERAHKLTRSEISERDFRLDGRRPRSRAAGDSEASADSLAELIEIERRKLRLLEHFQCIAAGDTWGSLPRGEGLLLSDVLQPRLAGEAVSSDEHYRFLGMRWYGGGPFVREIVSGGEVRAKTVYRVRAGDLIYNRLFAWRGSFGVVPPELDGCVVSNEFPLFELRQDSTDRIMPEYLRLCLEQRDFWADVEVLSTGTTPMSRNRLKVEDFLSMTIPVPDLDAQQQLVQRAGLLRDVAALRRDAAAPAGGLLPPARS